MYGEHLVLFECTLGKLKACCCTDLLGAFAFDKGFSHLLPFPQLRYCQCSCDYYLGVHDSNLSLMNYDAVTFIVADLGSAVLSHKQLWFKGQTTASNLPSEHVPLTNPSSQDLVSK